MAVPRGAKLADYIGQEPEKAGAFDGLRQLALLLRRNGGDSRRDDLAALRNIAREETGVLVIDFGRVRAGKRAGFAATKERPAGRGGRCHQEPASSIATVSSRGRLGALSPRSGRGPRPRSPRSWRSPRSSSSRLRIIADEPCSRASTRTVMKRMTSSLMPICRSISASAAGGASMFKSEKCALRFFLIR